MTSSGGVPPNLWVLLGLGVAGLILLARSRRKLQPIPKDYDAFIKTLQLLPPPQPAPPIAPHPLTNFTFAIKDIFDVEGFVTGFGNPDWERTHEPASRTAPVVSALVQAGATCVGKTHMDEMAYSINGENKHYGTPVNPAAPTHVPGGSSSGSAVAVAAGSVDFALGTDTGGSVRIPAAYCGILGFRPSHGVISCTGVVPMSQSLDTIGWFARDPNILQIVGHILLPQSYSDSKWPRRVLIAEDCFKLLSNLSNRQLSVVINSMEKALGRQVIIRLKLGEYLSMKMKSLTRFEISGEPEPSIAALKSLRNALQLLLRYEFKTNHEEWLRSVKPVLGPGISERANSALEADTMLVNESLKVRDEARKALNELLMDDGILVIPTAPGPPPKLRTKVSSLADFRDKAFMLLSVAGMSGSCQVSIPFGNQDGCPGAISLVAKHGADRLLLETVKKLLPVLRKEEEALAVKGGQAAKPVRKPEAAETAKERGNVAFKKKDFKTAIDCYSEAIRHDEKNPTYYSNRAAAYLALCSFRQAEVDCGKAIDLDKKNIKAYMRRGTAREFLGYYKEADEDFKQALVLEPMNRTASDGVDRLKKLLYG